MDYIDTYEIATVLYNLAKDMDYMDYEEVEDGTIKQIEICLYDLKCIAQNSYNSDYFRVFLECLEAIKNNVQGRS